MAMAVPAVIGPKQLWGLTKKSPFSIIGVLFSFFFLVNGSVIFGESWEGWQLWTIVFVMMILAGMALTPLEIRQTPAVGVLMWFVIGFISGIVLFTLVFRNVGIPSPFPVGALWAVVIFQVFVVTFAEETFFRQLLTSRIGIIPSALAFGAFHYAAYSSQVDFSYIFLLTPFIFGLAFGFLYLRTRHVAGIGLVWALHASFNLAVLGISFF